MAHPRRGKKHDRNQHDKPIETWKSHIGLVLTVIILIALLFKDSANWVHMGEISVAAIISNFLRCIFGIED